MMSLHSGSNNDDNNHGDSDIHNERGETLCFGSWKFHWGKGNVAVLSLEKYSTILVEMPFSQLRYLSDTNNVIFMRIYFIVISITNTLA